MVDAAAAPYRDSGRFAWYFARGKLMGDPAFAGLLRLGLIPPAARVLDLGSGQGLLASWLLAAQQQHARGDWPQGWPAAPQATVLQGIELMPRDVDRARAALGNTATFIQGDICQAEFSPSDTVVILDVLHYITLQAQDAVLRRACDALAPGGVLLLRVGDAAGGLRFRISNWVDFIVTRMRGHATTQLYCRTLTDWMQALQQLGFSVEAIPMSQGTPFANVLLVARKQGVCMMKEDATSAYPVDTDAVGSQTLPAALHRDFHTTHTTHAAHCGADHSH
jgi:SAM-dependent methyltransferase